MYVTLRPLWRTLVTKLKLPLILVPFKEYFIRILHMFDYTRKMAAIEELKTKAAEARAHAHCPYSNFRVGAAVLCEDGSIFVGVNVENASYGLTVCAERVAIMNAVSGGHTSLKAIAVCCDVANDFKASCGACRQVMAEFGLDWDVHLVKPDMTSLCISVRDLVPRAFTPDCLTADRVS